VPCDARTNGRASDHGTAVRIGKLGHFMALQWQASGDRRRGRMGSRPAIGRGTTYPAYLLAATPVKTNTPAPMMPPECADIFTTRSVDPTRRSVHQCTNPPMPSISRSHAPRHLFSSDPLADLSCSSENVFITRAFRRNLDAVVCKRSRNMVRREPQAAGTDMADQYKFQQAADIDKVICCKRLPDVPMGDAGVGACLLSSERLLQARAVF
jgi:hypothetical protein